MRAGRILCAALLLAGALAPARVSAEACYNVGAWNIEHFNDSARRGFPEEPGAYPPRGSSEITALARTIRDVVDAKILALSEINGVPGKRQSVELANLTRALGPTWEYRIAVSGSKQRVALIWDTRFARLTGEAHEIFVAEKRIDDADIFARDPLIGHFTLLEDGAPRNDLVLVALHLASGQRRTANHDAAMRRLRGELRALRGKVDAYPGDEDDVILAGDLNASAFDRYRESFFVEFDRGNWKLLAEEGYPRTRFNGSQIDYLIATTRRGRQKGLVGEELTAQPARVWSGLAANGDKAFRKKLSDHFPVTTCVKVIADTD